MTEAIELRPDLPQLSADDLVVIDRLVLARHLERLRNPEAVVPRPVHRHAGLVDVTELIDVALGDGVLRLEHFGGSEPVRSAALIVGAPT